jgi:molybdopterin-guanine dinucleotide biosynthesis protein A
VEEKVTLAIQAGGRSVRMGADKALMPFLGRPLIQQVLDRLAGLGDELLVTTNQPDGYKNLGLRLVGDILPWQGALGGVYTSLASATHPLVVVAACDMPFASLAIFQAALRLLQDNAVDAVVPHPPAGLEPLHAVYRREACLPVIRHALEAGELKAIGWFRHIRLREMTPGEIQASDPSGLAFWNINTRQEFIRAEKMARSMKDEFDQHNQES